MKTLRSLTLVLLAVFLTFQTASAMNNTAVGEVLKLRAAGLGDESIIAFIQRNNVDYALSATDLVALKNQGVSSPVLAAMVSSGSAPTPVLSPTPSPVLTPVVTPTPPPSLPAPAPPSTIPASPAPLSPDAAYFYQQLSPYGRWIVIEDGQWSWQPTVAVSSRTWRPYWDQGHWVFTDNGWYWASEYPWGWAAFHYGRWRLHPLHGWVWFPDRVWAPAWVTWRTSPDFCGWAPLPPGTFLDPAGALLYRGSRVGLDFDFGLDWRHFNFCSIRSLGENRLPRFRTDEERRRVFARTTVINNYTVHKVVVENRPETRIINHGIDPARVAAIKGRRLETVTIQDLHAPAPNRAHEHFDKNKRTMEVFRPTWGESAGRRP